MDLQQSSTSKRHSTHTDLSVNSPNTTRTIMVGVENIQTIQSISIEPEPLETSGEMKHGHEMLLSTSAKFSEACIWNFVYLVIIIGGASLFSIPITLIPLHNSIEFPGYWWEIIIIGISSAAINAVLNTVLECQLIFDLECFKSFKVGLRLYAYFVLVDIVTICMCYIIWTASMGYNHPIPYLGGILFIVLFIEQCIAIWFQFPYQLRNKTDVRKRIWTYILYKVWLVFYGIQLMNINKIMTLLPLDMHWIMAILLPIHREMNLWVIDKLLQKSTDFGSTVPLIPKLTATVVVNTAHAGFVAMIIGSVASDITSYSILAVDFMMNLFITYKIIKLHRKVSPTDDREKEARMVEKAEYILQLFAIETAEFLAPIIYSITFSMAFYGPNAEITGNIKGDHWTFQKIEDIESFQANLFLMLLIDSTSCIISGFALWKFASAELLQEGCKMMKVFFPFLAVTFGRIYENVSFIEV